MLGWMHLRGEDDDVHEESSQWWIDALEESLHCTWDECRMSKYEEQGLLTQNEAKCQLEDIKMFQRG